MRSSAVMFSGMGIVLVALSLALLMGARLWSMAALPVWDPSEARYATLAANMEASGDYVRPVFFHHDVRQTFAGKPPLAFWLGGLACHAFGRSAFAVRLPSLLCALGVLAVLRWASGGWCAPSLCATMGGFVAFSGLCMTDMPLTFAVCGMLCVFWRWIRRPSLGLALLGGGFAAAGFLAKGPVALALGGLPPLVWCAFNGLPGEWRTRHVFAAAMLFLALSAPWFALLEMREPGTLRYFFLNENVARFLTQRYGDRYGHGHAFFRGVSVPWTLSLTFPWGLFLLRRGAVRRLRRCFPALATLGMVGFWALTPRVPPAYLLPAVPMAAWWVARRPVRALAWWPIAALVFALVLALATPLLPRISPRTFPLALYRSLPEGATLSFEGCAPYSAEFYLGPRVRRDGSGAYFARRVGRHWALEARHAADGLLGTVSDDGNLNGGTAARKASPATAAEAGNAPSLGKGRGVGSIGS